MMSFANLPYRPCVGLAIFNREGKVLVAERLDNNTAWQMPQGGIDEGEDLTEAAFREMKEEIGTDKAEILEIMQTPLLYDLPPELLGRLWGGKYRGQEQIWIALRFTGDDNDIDLNAHEPAEFSRWQWVDLVETVNLIVPFKRDTYSKIIKEFLKYTI
ncbi:MAG: RNA pyrophosphohydrolase [Micavibrio aeruginosavorus]|uniref:RNA pyrophosphohydrolase n=1 Tax=Micavibrio aeruginosavorus TaxID=349221 RepID=A0A2W5FI80_9BACT|nr:MAG: RNA pyrophosphohydrolase [Micavibrio aeruginosavorus]